MTNARYLVSRNKREGHLYGWVKGKFIRIERSIRDKSYVSSWYAFRVYSDRKRAAS